MYFCTKFENENINLKTFKKMKNIFKFMGIALMASALLVACNKDKENENTDTTPAPVQASYSITFNGEVQNNLEYASAMTNGEVWAFQAALRAEGNSVYFPYFVFYFVTEDGVLSPFTEYTEAYIETYYTLDGSNYGDWQVEDVETFNVSKLDATARVLSLDADYLMYSLTDYIDSTIADGQERTTNLVLNLTNYEFAAASK